MMQTAQLASGPRLLDAQEFQIARDAQMNHGSLDKVAVTLGFSSEESAVKALAATLGLDFVDLSTLEPDLSVLDKFPVKLIHRYGVFPFADPRDHWLS